MTAAEVYESITNLIRVAETHPGVRHLIPNEVLTQLGVSGT
jgi:hypothetical protein